MIFIILNIVKNNVYKNQQTLYNNGLDEFLNNK